MGRDLGVLWPEVLHRQDAENRSLRDQLAPEIWWNGELPRTFADHRVPILGQVAVGSLVTDILLDLGIAPDAAIGYSMGESAALVALRAWTDRDELIGPADIHPRCSRPSWPVPAMPLDGPGVSRPTGRSTGSPGSCRVRPKTSARRSRRPAIGSSVRPDPEHDRDETVIGGERPAVQDVVRALRCPFLELPAVSTVHCEIGRLVEAEYRALHDIETVAPPRIAFYSGVSGRRYAVDRRSAAEAIAAQASQPIDFPATIENAYADGIGLFIEVGPGQLVHPADRPHPRRSPARRPARPAGPIATPFAAVLEVLADCIAHRVPVDLSRLYGDDEAATARAAVSRPQPTIRVDVGPGEFRVPPLPSRPETSRGARWSRP